MQDKNLKVLVVENEKIIRHNMVKALKRRNFDCFGAGTVDEANGLVQEHGKDTVAMVLDVRLEDKAHPGITGLDLAMKWKDQLGASMPYVIVHSAYPEEHYFQAAGELGALAYLHKSDQDTDTTTVSSLVRTLALRGLLKQAHANNTHSDLVQMAPSRAGLLQLFCTKVLKEHFETYLGLNYFILFQEKGQSRSLLGPATGENCPEFWNTVSALTLAYTGSSRSFSLSFDKYPSLGCWSHFKETLDGSVILPIYQNREMSLSLGMCQTQGLTQEDPEKLVNILARYYKPQLHNHINDLVMEWSKLEERRRTQLETSAQTLNYFSNFFKLAEQEEHDPTEVYQYLKDQLDRESQWVADLANEMQNNHKTEGEVIQLESAIERAFKKARRRGCQSRIEIGQATFALNTNPDSFEDVITTVAQWFMGRAHNISEHYIKVTFHVGEKWNKISIIDNSRQLPKVLRTKVFNPFGASLREKGELPYRHMTLFSARSQMEIRHQGRLIDETEENRPGHCFSLWFPADQSLEHEHREEEHALC